MPQKRVFKKYTYRGIELDDLLDKNDKELAELFCARQRRKMKRGFKPKEHHLYNRLKKAKKVAGEHEKPAPVKTHLRSALVLPHMVGSVLGVYNGKEYALVEVRPEMIGHYLGEFSITYRPVRHGRAGVGSAQMFIPLK